MSGSWMYEETSERCLHETELGLIQGPKGVVELHQADEKV